jgi:hypothetical protein
MAHTDFEQAQSPGENDLDEHLRTYAQFRRWAMWGALGTPLLLAFVLYWTV